MRCRLGWSSRLLSLESLLTPQVQVGSSFLKWGRRIERRNLVGSHLSRPESRPIPMTAVLEAAQPSVNRLAMHQFSCFLQL